MASGILFASSMIHSTEYRVCKADHKKYVKDDYEESLEGSDKNSRVGMASASSSSYTTTTTTTNTTRTTKTTDSRSTGTDASRTPGQVFSQGSTHVDHADGKAQIPRYLTVCPSELGLLSHIYLKQLLWVRLYENLEQEELTRSFLWFHPKTT